MENVVVALVIAVSVAAVLLPVLRNLRKDRSAGASPCGGGSCAGCNCSVVSKVAVVLLLVVATPALALDTVETFDVGPSNAEYYMGFGGVGQAAGDRELSNELVFGLGITPTFSAYMATCVAVDQQRFQGETSLCFGLLGTAVDSDHFDLDLMLDVGAAGEGMGTLSLAPMVELNYDADPDMGTWGLYLRSGVAAYGETAVEGADPRRVTDLAVNPGAYLRLNDGNELLVEYDFGRAMGDDRGEVSDVHGLAIGWNTMVNSSVELLTQIHRDLPETGTDATWSLNLGFIATLPGGN